jgi:2-amino-4-hydroxy-6-hydroxymethyldihydropteridine diphosphokinase
LEWRSSGDVATSDAAAPSARAFVGVGSNIRPEENVLGALALLERNPGIRIVGVSTFYRTPALPAPGASEASVEAAPDYLNGVVELRTVLDAGTLAVALEETEAALGRVRTAERYASRTMDLDLLLFLSPAPLRTSGVSHGETAPPPHPEIRTRAFVAVPLLELAPDLLLPPDGTPLKDIADAFPGPGGEAEITLTERIRERFLTE